ncbi:MAG TPA: hypothetical protein PKC28_04930 [Bdellovibrionales bacterium]|nr:hypothetical protein [Bdellovibrionales bacterium]
MGFIKKIHLSLVWTALIAIGCAKASFSDNDSHHSLDNSSSGQTPDEGVIKNSYFFVKRQADILFVIDTSTSMSEEQTLLQSGFPSFTSTINTYSGGTLDWHIAITSTDVSGAGPGTAGALIAFAGTPASTYYLDSRLDVAVANAAFQSTVILGVGGSADERGIAAARMTAQREFNPATSRGFLRPDTPLSVIVLSDEDEASTGPDSPSWQPIDEPANFVPAIRALDAASTGLKTITFHSLVTSTQACLDGPGSYMGETYMSLSRMTNGIIGDICALTGSYQQQLEAMAVNIVNEARTYTLNCGKISGGTVKLYEQTLSGALVFVPSSFLPPNKVILESAPAVGSLIKANFLCMD